MTRLNSNRTDATRLQQLPDVDLDAFIIDNEFDDLLDRELFAIREFVYFRNT